MCIPCNCLVLVCSLYFQEILTTVTVICAQIFFLFLSTDLSKILAYMQLNYSSECFKLQGDAYSLLLNSQKSWRHQTPFSSSDVSHRIHIRGPFHWNRRKKNSHILWWRTKNLTKKWNEMNRRNIITHYLIILPSNWNDLLFNLGKF